MIGDFKKRIMKLALIVLLVCTTLVNGECKQGIVEFKAAIDKLLAAIDNSVYLDFLIGAVKADEQIKQLLSTPKTNPTCFSKQRKLALCLKILCSLKGMLIISRNVDRLVN